MRDHLMGYPPAVWERADWPAKPYPLGIPRRVWDAPSKHPLPPASPLMRIIGDTRMTEADRERLHFTAPNSLNQYHCYDPVPHAQQAYVDEKILTADAHAIHQQARNLYNEMGSVLYGQQARCVR